MLKSYTVSFFGHSRIYNQLHLDRTLDNLIFRLLKENSYVEFLVGRDGDFDQLVSSAIKRCQRECGHHNSSHIWVMPYIAYAKSCGRTECHYKDSVAFKFKDEPYQARLSSTEWTNSKDFITLRRQ